MASSAKRVKKTARRRTGDNGTDPSRIAEAVLQALREARPSVPMEANVGDYRRIIDEQETLKRDVAALRERCEKLDDLVGSLRVTLERVLRTPFVQNRADFEEHMRDLRDSNPTIIF